VSTISPWNSTGVSRAANIFRSLGLALALVSVFFCQGALQSAALAEPAPVKVPLIKGSTGGCDNEPKSKDIAKAPADMLAAMDQLVLSEAKTMSAMEYARDREVGHGKLSSCLADCFVVLYLLEGIHGRGSKNSAQYMAAFTYIAGKPLLLGSAQIGGRGLRYASIKSIGPELINLTTQTYLPKDSIDNPTGKGHATYAIANKHLIELP